MAYLYLFIAILAEVVATSALKATNAFTKLIPSLIVVIGYTCAFYFLSLTLKTIPIGIAYAIWSGLGIVLIAMIGTFWYREALDIFAILGIVLILVGLLVTTLFSNSVSH